MGRDKADQGKVGRDKVSRGNNGLYSIAFCKRRRDRVEEV